MNEGTGGKEGFFTKMWPRSVPPCSRPKGRALDCEATEPVVCPQGNKGHKEGWVKTMDGSYLYFTA